MRIDLHCAECGGNNFALDQVETDECEITCGDCGHEIGTMAQLKEQIAKQVIDQAKLAEPIHNAIEQTSSDACGV